MISNYITAPCVAITSYLATQITFYDMCLKLKQKLFCMFTMTSYLFLSGRSQLQVKYPLSPLPHENNKKGFTSNSILVAVVFTPFFEMYFTYLFNLQRFFLVHFIVLLGKKTHVVLIPQMKRDTILLQVFLHQIEILLESDSYFLKRSDCYEVNKNNLFCNPIRLSGLGHQTMSLIILEGTFF